MTPRPADSGDTGPVHSGSTQQRQPSARFAKNITRYLCTAAQIDSSFCQRLVRQVVEEPRRAVASSPGVDLETVLRYALSARNRQIIRDTLLALATALWFFILFRVGPDAPSPLLLSVGLIVVAWAIVFGEQLVAYYGVVARRLRHVVFQKDHAPKFVSRRINARLRQIADADRGNITVFRGYSPFLGYGTIIGNWSFAVNIAKPATGRTVRPFTVQELHDHIAARVAALALPGVAIEDRVLVNGDDLLDEIPASVERQILPDRFAAPAGKVEDALVRQLLTDSQGRARTYLCVRIAGWSGELVLCVFLRFDVSPASDLLFVEASYSLLTPIRDTYREVDLVYSRTNPVQVFRIMLRSTRVVTLRVAACWPSLIRFIATPLLRIFRNLRDRWHILGEHSFNYGARLSVREAASDKRYRRYFHQLDSEMYAKTAERRILDALVEFLEDHGIDTTEITQRSETILNNGVLVTGQGSVRANSIVAGANPVVRTVNRVADRSRRRRPT